METKPDFAELLRSLRNEILDLARKAFTDRIKEAEEDSDFLISQCTHKLERWASELAAGRMSKDDFEYHVGSLRSVMALARLKRAGINHVRMDKFREDLLSVISSSIFKWAGVG